MKEEGWKKKLEGSGSVRELDECFQELAVEGEDEVGGCCCWILLGCEDADALGTFAGLPFCLAQRRAARGS